MGANKGFKGKEIVCHFVNSNEVVKLLKKHVDNFQRIFKYKTNYVSMCKYNSY